MFAEVLSLYKLFIVFDLIWAEEEGGRQCSFREAAL